MYKHELVSVILATSLLITAATSSAAQGIEIPAGAELELVPVNSPFKKEDQPTPAQFTIKNPELRGCRVTVAVKWAPSASRYFSSGESRIQCDSWQGVVSGVLTGNQQIGASLTPDERVAFLLKKSAKLPSLAGAEKQPVKHD
ncbi:hypothetical protein [Burkholderia cepacia]|uniref:hypothetical protein n=1 Tax=Burkholderia cepacia TaxID=292 RepID=UPI0006657EE0|nr:hypothetical protein [Burkholderia cepacia]